MQRGSALHGRDLCSARSPLIRQHSWRLTSCSPPLGVRAVGAAVGRAVVQPREEAEPGRGELLRRDAQLVPQLAQRRPLPQARQQISVMNMHARVMSEAESVHQCITGIICTPSALQV